MSIPLPVLQFALLDSKDGGITPAHPISWHETATEWIIIYEDGRKLRHAKTEERPVQIRTQVEGNEASAKGKKTERQIKHEERMS